MLQQRHALLLATFNALVEEFVACSLPTEVVCSSLVESLR